MLFNEDKLQELLDREDIRTTLALYARGVDRRNWAMVREAYHEDAYDDHGGYKGNVAGLLAWIERRHATIEQSMHLLGNSLITFQSPMRAVAETYCVVYQRFGEPARETIKLWIGDVELGPGEYVVATMPCRYVDRMEKRAGVWRILYRTVVFEEVKAIKAQSLLSDAWTLARRDTMDALWLNLEAAGTQIPCT